MSLFPSLSIYCVLTYAFTEHFFWVRTHLSCPDVVTTKGYKNENKNHKQPALSHVGPVIAHFPEIDCHLPLVFFLYGKRKEQDL